MPHGLEITDVVEARTRAFVDRLEASQWQVELPGLDVPVVREALVAFLGRETVVVQRLLKAGMRSFDARGAVASAHVDDTPALARPAGSEPCAILRLVVRHASPSNGIASVRPDDILTGIRQVSGLEPPAPPVVTRLAQGPLDDR